MHDSVTRAARIARVQEPQVAPISALVEHLRSELRRSDIPYVDPDCGGVRAKVLLLLEDPGPMASGNVAASGLLSWDNDDPTAARCAALIEDAGLRWHDVVPWNAWPWPKPRGRQEVADRALLDFIALLPDLRAVLALGVPARERWDRVAPRLRHRDLVVAKGVHPARRGLTNGGRQSASEGIAQLQEAFARAARAIQTA